MKILNNFKGRFLIICLIIAMLSFVVTGCKKEESDEPRPTASVATEIPADEPMTQDEDDEMSAEEAADDTEAIANELADITSLIGEELYHDALMSVNALLTKNLTDEQKNKVMELKTIIDAKLGQ